MRSLFFITVVFCVTAQLKAQTGAEKIASQLCICAQEHDYAKHVAILKSNNQEAIRGDFEKIEFIFRETKRCAKRQAKLTPEEGKRIPEEEIDVALAKNCPDVKYLAEQYRLVSAQIMKEEREKDIEDRLKVINEFAQAKNQDSVSYYIKSFISNYGRFESFVFSLIECYYLAGDFSNGNFEAEVLIEQFVQEMYFHDDRTDQSVPLKDFVKKRLIDLATKYKQTEIVEAAKSKL